MAAAFIPFLLMGASALGGALSNKSKTNTQTQQTKQTSEQSGSSRPLYDEGQLDVRNFLLRELMGNVEQTPGFQDAYTRSGILNINQGADRVGNQIRQAMMSRGLGRTSAGLTPEIANENARYAAQSKFINDVPLKMDELQRNRMRDLTQFFASLPVGTSNQQSSTSTGNSTGTSTTPNNMLGGGLSGLSQMGAFLYGSGAFDGRNNNVQSVDYGNAPPSVPIWNPITGRME